MSDLWPEIDSKKRVLVTGIGGNIGAHLMAHIFTNTNWEIVGLDSFRQKGDKSRIDDFCADHPDWKPRLHLFQTDLCCPISEKLRSDMGKIDYILHLAAISDVQFSVENPVYSIKNNVDSTLVMLELAREIKPDVFIQFSTDEIYGPVAEGSEAHKEWDTHRPSNPYSASKAATEDIAYAYWRTYDVPVIITNTMNNFGEAQSGSKFPAIVQSKVNAGEVVKIHGNSEEIGSRFYIHSRNVADAMLWILNKGAYHHKPGKIDEPHKYHIVGNKRLNNLELAQMIAGYMGKDLKFEFQDFHKDNPGHDIHYGMIDTKLRAGGWTPPISLEDSLKNTVEWQMVNTKWLRWANTIYQF